MRVSSVLFGTGIHVPKVSNDINLSEFAYRPRQNVQQKSSMTAMELKKLVAGLAVLAVVVTLSRLKMPIKKNPVDLVNVLC